MPATEAVSTSEVPLRSSRRNVVPDLLADHINQAVFVVTAVVVGVGYSVLLPFAYTQRVTWHNWHYLDARYVAFSVAFGLTTGWIVAVQTFAMRRVAAQRGSALGGTGAVLGLLPSFLCCTPVVPTVLSFVGLSGATLTRTSGRTQHFFATKQNLILAASLALVVSAAIWGTRRLHRAICMNGTGCVPGNATSSRATEEIGHV